MPELPELSLIHIPATRSDKATQSHSFQSRAGNFQTQDVGMPGAIKKLRYVSRATINWSEVRDLLLYF